MSKVLITESSLSNIGNAIRQKLGGSTQYKPSEMASAISSIPSGSTLVTKNITANGTYNATDDNADGYSSVTVAIPSASGVSF